MVTVQDSALTDFRFIDKWIQDNAIFKTEHYGYDTFEIARVPDDISEIIISDIYNDTVDVKYSFLRLSTNEIDADIRIHADTSMDSEYASVLYFNNPPSEDDCGTAFWEHSVYGDECAVGVNGLEDCDNLDMWNLKNVINMKKNRLITYPTKLFHSRYPFKGWGKDKADGRVVWGSFFNEKKEL